MVSLMSSVVFLAILVTCMVDIAPCYPGDIIPGAPPISERPDTPAGESVPEIKEPPRAHPLDYGIPIVHSRKSADGETVVLSNDMVKAELLINAQGLVSMVSLSTSAGRELLAEPSSCFTVVDAKGSIIKDGSAFKIDSWHSWQHSSYAEAEIRLLAPEPVIWRLRLYRDKPYLEQRFEMPSEWRAAGCAVVQNLSTVESLRPVMPNDALGRGFTGGRPKIKGSHRFEFVEQSDHLIYDSALKTGLAAFVAGIGGEERINRKQVTLLDHVTEQFGASEPVARFIIWPFDGPVETGFTEIRRFIDDEYACEGDRNGVLEWTQFMTWQWVPRQPRKPTNPATDPYFRQEVTADRIMDILPHVAAMGFDTFHIDAGWETSFADDGWRFDPERFPNGFEPIRRFLREHGMRYMTWWGCSNMADNPAEVIRLIEETDLVRLFHDRMVGEKTVASMREVRKRYPGFECFVHNTNSRSKYYPAGNIHYVSDFNQVYVSEEEYLAWSHIPPEPTPSDVKYNLPFTWNNMTAGDLVTRTSAYQHGWAWPFKCALQVSWPWAGMEDRSLRELSGRAYSMLAGRYASWWSEDPRDLRPEVMDFFLDFAAFFRTTRSYFQVYQHVLPVPDGYHPDGSAHIKGGRGFIVLCNPAMKSAKVAWKELFWEPELELDPNSPVEVTDWTRFLSPRKLTSVDLMKPEGNLIMEPLSYRVLGININMAATLSEVKHQRSLLHYPPEGSK